jgi:hypothetical protein
VEPETTASAEPDAPVDASVPREQGARIALPASGSGSLRPLYVTPRGLTRCVAACLVASTLVTWVALGVHLAHLRELHLLLSGSGGNPQQLATISWALTLAQSAQLAIYALTALFFLAWLYRLRINVRAFGVRKLAFARHWSVLGFFVPVLNVVRPYQVIAEVWRASDPAELDPFEWKALEPPQRLAIWWAIFVIAVTLQLAAFGFSLTAGAPAFESIVASVVAIIADLAAAVSASISYFLVLRLGATQMAKHERLRLEVAHA